MKGLEIEEKNTITTNMINGSRILGRNPIMRGMTMGLNPEPSMTEMVMWRRTTMKSWN